MSHDIHHDQEPIQNVCLTGTVVMAAFCLGLAITAILFVWAFKIH